MKLTKKQVTALRCAYADLQGALQARDQLDIEAHDWAAHKQSIFDLEEAFPDVVGGTKEVP